MWKEEGSGENCMGGRGCLYREGIRVGPVGPAFWFGPRPMDTSYFNVFFLLWFNWLSREIWIPFCWRLFVGGAVVATHRRQRRVAAWPLRRGLGPTLWGEAAPEASPGSNLFCGEKLEWVLKYRRERERRALLLARKWREVSCGGEFWGPFSDGRTGWCHVWTSSLVVASLTFSKTRREN